MLSLFNLAAEGGMLMRKIEDEKSENEDLGSFFFLNIQQSEFQGVGIILRR